MDFIEELYCRNINSYAKRLNYNAKYAKALKLICKNEEKLTNALSGKELEMFCELVNANEKILTLSCKEEFKRGFRLGVMMMCDSFRIEEKIFKDIK